MKDVQDELASWAELYKHCLELQRRFDAAKAPGSGVDPKPIEVELLAAKARAEAALEGLSAVLKRESGTPPAS